MKIPVDPSSSPMYFGLERVRRKGEQRDEGRTGTESRNGKRERLRGEWLREKERYKKSKLVLIKENLIGFHASSSKSFMIFPIFHFIEFLGEKFCDVRRALVS